MHSDTLLTFCNTLQDPVIVSDDKGRLIMANPAFCDMLGYSRQEMIRLDLPMLIPEHRRQDQDRQLQACLQGRKIVAVTSELQNRDARLVPVLLTLSIFHLDDAPGPRVVWIFRKPPASEQSLERLNIILESKVEAQDIALEAEVSERHGVENELRLSHKQLRMLSQKTLELLESDRQVIAKELHDSIGASLAAIKFSLEGWLEVYGDHLPSPEIPFERIIAHIVETIKETKRISANLRPSTLDDLGLLATAKWFCRDLSGLYASIQITPSFNLDEADIPEAYKIVLYRVMQEALSNAAKHSGAKSIQVALSKADNFIEMSISDNGRGFDLDRVLEAEDTLSGFGINSMRERIEICNGCFDIRSREGEGTHIRVFLPVEENTTHHLF